MRRLLRNLGLAGVGLIAAAQWVPGPRPTNPAVDPSKTIEAHMRVPAEVSAILDRACKDCHSNETSWPAYAYVKPVGSFVVGHVNQGRRSLNFSNWERTPGSHASAYQLKAICGAVRGGRMPLPSYTLLHWSARLSDSDVDTLCEWANREFAAEIARR